MKPRLTRFTLLFVVVFFSCFSIAKKFDPNMQPQTTVFFQHIPSPTLSLLVKNGPSLKIPGAFSGFGVSVAYPFYPYLHAGFAFQISYLGQFPPSDNRANPKSMYGVPLEISALIKPQLPLATSFGDFAFALPINIGVLAGIGGLANAIQSRQEASFGEFGFSGQLAVQVDYFFLDWIGIYISGGYRYNLMINFLRLPNPPPLDLQPKSTLIFDYGGFSFSTGLKVTI